MLTNYYTYLFQTLNFYMVKHNSFLIKIIQQHTWINLIHIRFNLFINCFRENKINAEGAKSIASNFEYLKNIINF